MGKAWIIQRGGQSEFGDQFAERFGRVHMADTAAQFAVLVKGDEGADAPLKRRREQWRRSRAAFSGGIQATESIERGLEKQALLLPGDSKRFSREVAERGIADRMREVAR